MDHVDYDYNQHDYNRPKRSEVWGLFFVFAVIGILAFFTFPAVYDLETFYPQEPKVLTIREGVGMGTLDKDHDELVSKIRKDLKLSPNLSIEIFIGPYQNITGEARMIPLVNPLGIIVLIDQDFYKLLTPEEKTALIAHELGHLTNEEMLTFSLNILIKFQIEADTYSTKYAEPTAMISALNKMVTLHNGIKPVDYGPRIQNLEKIKRSKQTQQAH